MVDAATENYFYPVFEAHRGGIMPDILHHFSAIGLLQLISYLSFLIYVLSLGFAQLGRKGSNGAKYALCNVLAAYLVAINLIAEFNCPHLASGSLPVFSLPKC